MRQFVRGYAGYIIAVVAGFVAVPAFYYLDLHPVLSAHLFKAVFIGSIGIILAMSWLFRKDFPHRKTWVAAEVVLIVVMLPVAGGTGMKLYDSYTAWQGEDTHWHADFQVVVDGETHEMIDPHKFCGDGLLCMVGNHTGGNTLHEHDDQRIHVHGPVARPADATLGAFFEAVGGELTASAIRYPTNDGWVNRTNTDGKTVKVLVQQGERGDRTWTHLDDPHDYIISPYTDGPIDQLVFIYDDRSAADALADVRQDDAYRGVAVQ